MMRFPTLPPKIFKFSSRFYPSTSQFMTKRHISSVKTLPAPRLWFGSAIVGAGFGFFLQKAHVIEPLVIQNQLLLTDFTMMKTFLAATATSTLILNLSQRIGHLSRPTPCNSPQRSVTTTAIGSFVLGTGMAVAGACPGTVFAQLGSNVETAFNVFLGGSAAVFLFYHLEPHLSRWIYSSKKMKKEYFEQLFKAHRFTSAILFACMLYALTWAFHMSTPLPHPESPSLSLENIESILAGVGIGVMQYISMLLMHDTIGMSGLLVFCMAPFNLLTKSLFHSHTRIDWSPILKKSLQKALFLSSVVFGAFVGSHLQLQPDQGYIPSVSRPVYTPHSFEQLTPTQQSLLGGFLLFLGARIAGGCTSSHGISGMGQMKVKSAVAVAAMFAGGIGMAQLSRANGWINTK